MASPIRTERRFGVTSQLSQQARRNIMQVRNGPEWDDILDVIEMCCIEIESALINTSSDKEAEVLANHKMAKAAWLIFTHMQEKIDTEVSHYLASITNQPLVPDLTADEQEQENILDPTRPRPIDYYEN